MRETWLSAHIYYGEPFEELLIKGIKPFVEKLKADDLMNRYFYIRYWEQGPHVRLRIQGNPKVLIEQVKPRLQRTFDRYMKDHPSVRQEPVWVNTLPANQQWHPNNSVQFIAYEPEVSRYGGEHVIGLAEEHFQHSSDTVLALISSGKKWNYERALGAALQLHLSFTHASGLDLSQTQSFFSRVYAGWLPRVYQIVSVLTKQEEKKIPQEVQAAFEETFERQKASLIPFMRSFWKLLQDVDSFEKTWLNEWIRKINEMDEKLRIKQENGELDPPYRIETEVLNSKDKKILERWSIYDSFIHMTNNRLGILNRDEGYLGYLLMEGLKHEATKQ